ncbi:MAG: glycosyltransferase family 4 protein [Pseudomonadota bacterium]
MPKKATVPATQKRKPRLLWANPFCLLDTSSGASISVRQMLHQLVDQGYEVRVLGATVFDNPKGMGLLKEQYPNLNNDLHQRIEVQDGPLDHQLVVTQRPERLYMTAHEQGLWHGQYVYLLDSFKPDLVWFYGGQTLDLLIADEARMRDIPSAAYLVNSNYKSVRWCRDVNLIVTDTYATSDMYRKTVGFVPRPVGKFIEHEQFVASQHEPLRLLFVNPSWAKGASVFVQLAEKLDRERPDITLEVVEARADWSAVLRETTKRIGQQRESLSNVHVTPNTSDMRGPYSRARVLVAPSLWWESGARVLAESMLNGIPAIVSDSGGNREMVKEGGWVVDLPDACFEKPYQHLLSEVELQPLFDAVVALFDDEALYQEFVKRACIVGQELHHIEVSTSRLLDAFSPLVNQRAGSKDFQKSQRRTHKHKLAGTTGKPDFKAMPIPASAPNRSARDTVGLTVSQPEASDFDWQLKSKIIVLDNRAKLMKTGLADKLATTNAFGVVAFDPVSQVDNPEKYAGSESIQVFQHALLGDGQQATLYACVAPELTSTLQPLPDDDLPESRRFGAKVITKLPINTIALDSINGLDDLDWLILDEFSDAINILAHGEKILKDTLLIQARVAFQPTHENQPSLAELQHWASRNGFRFYRLNDMSYHSLFDQPESSSAQASQLESADALFLPSSERLENMSENQIRKLAFLLHTVFVAQDAAYRVMLYENKDTAESYLKWPLVVGDKASEKVLNSNEEDAEGFINEGSCDNSSEKLSKVTLVSGEKVF